MSNHKRFEGHYFYVIKILILPILLIELEYCELHFHPHHSELWSLRNTPVYLTTLVSSIVI